MTAVGPVVLTLSAGHGVHAIRVLRKDPVALLAAYTEALVLTRRLA